MSKPTDTEYVQITTRVPKSLADELADLARKERRSMGNLLWVAAEMYLEQSKFLTPQDIACDEA